MGIIIDDDGVMHKVFTKDEVIAKLQDIRARAWYHHSQFDDDKDFEVDRAVEDIVSLIDIEISKLKENKYDG